jgi:aryl-alcohol dehydrogenase-like predicted oxidoreductase
VRVSPLCLGGASLGNQWTAFLRGGDKAAGFALLDAFYAAGGNYIDTANNYQDGMSEHIIGEWMAAKGNRDNVVLATKYTQMPARRAGENAPGVLINFGGNSKKSMKHSVSQRLR